jgi:hypothetical protein
VVCASWRVALGRWAIHLGGQRSVGGGGGRWRFGKWAREKWVRSREVVCGSLRGTESVGGRRSFIGPFSGWRTNGGGERRWWVGEMGVNFSP